MVKNSTKAYNKDSALNATLYIIEKNGGVCDLHRVFKTLYFADREHLARYGRSITRDAYIAMKYGPVPSCTDDILKAVRGDSYFSYAAGDFSHLFEFINQFMVKAISQHDADELSETDIECLDYAINLCKGLSFNQLTELSHGEAWSAVSEGREMNYSDMMREIGAEEEYALFLESQQKAMSHKEN